MAQPTFAQKRFSAAQQPPAAAAPPPAQGGRFGRPAAAAPPPAAAPPARAGFGGNRAAPPPARRGRFSNVRLGEGRAPTPKAGHYVGVIHWTKETHIPGKEPYFKGHVKIVYADPGSGNQVGQFVRYLQCTGASSESAAFPRIKALTMAATGFATEAEYDAFDPDGDFLAVVVGEADAFQAPNGDTFGRNPLAGQVIEFWVTETSFIRKKDGTEGQGCEWDPVQPVSAEDAAQFQADIDEAIAKAADAVGDDE